MTAATLTLRLRLTTAPTREDAAALLAELDRLAVENERLRRRVNRMVQSASVEDIGWRPET